MRAVVFVMLGACGFAPTPGSAGDAPGDDARMAIDARPIDAAMIDASPTCLTHATAQNGGHHYFRTAKEGWFTAQAECITFGGHLVKIETSAENDFVKALVANGYTWIGLSDPTSQDVYVWADGTPLGTYTGFAGTPPTGTPDCVDSNGVWDLFGCTQTNHDGVCECE